MTCVSSTWRFCSYRFMVPGLLLLRISSAGLFVEWGVFQLVVSYRILDITVQECDAAESTLL